MDSCAETTCSLPHDLHFGDHIVLNGHPCKIVEESHCKTGKHGCAKYMFTGIDIFTGKKYEGYFTGLVQVPEVNRKPYTLLGCSDDGYMCLQDDRFETRCDIRLPKYDEELAQKIKANAGNGGTVTIQSAMGIEEATDFKMN